tara:strand:- start:1321 stop:1941 length:621 start_codon:yes stop_codon:yes gene_type:complete
LKNGFDNCILAENKKKMREKIQRALENAIDNYNSLLNEVLYNKIELIVQSSIKAFENDNKLLLCGNGGSASDAQHIAAELSGRFYKNRPPLFAEALHVNSSFITAVANDYGYEQTYSRMVDAAGRKGDILFAFSTSGNSSNVLNAIKKAKEKGMFTVGFTGKDAGKMTNTCDVVLNIPSLDTARIQEGHILVGHIICQLIEDKMFS